MAKFRKALLAGASATVASLLAAAVTAGGLPPVAAWGAAVALGIAAGYGVYKVPNAT